MAQGPVEGRQDAALRLAWSLHHRVPAGILILTVGWLVLLLQHLDWSPAGRLIVWSGLVLGPLTAMLFVWVLARREGLTAARAAAWLRDHRAASAVLGVAWASSLYFLSPAPPWSDDGWVTLMTLAVALIVGATAIESPLLALRLAGPSLGLGLVALLAAAPGTARPAAGDPATLGVLLAALLFLAALGLAGLSRGLAPLFRVGASHPPASWRSARPLARALRSTQARP